MRTGPGPTGEFLPTGREKSFPHCDRRPFASWDKDDGRRKRELTQ